MFLKIVFLFLLAIHSIVSIFAFFKAFNIAGKNFIKKSLSKFEGVLWLLSSIIFLSTFFMILFHYSKWYYFGFLGVIFSQLLIFSLWSEAKHGTLINIIIFCVVVLKFTSVNYENKFRKESLNYLRNYNKINLEVLGTPELNRIPEIVKEYINYCNFSEGKKIYNFFLRLDGRMFIKKDKSFKFYSHQYNFLDKNIRIFFMKAKFYGIPVYAYHKYINGKASMIVKLCGLIPLVNAKGQVMNISETVTYFNDLCLFSPGSLLYKNIKWKEVNDSTVIATFSVNDITISAQLIFNNDGRLLNFISFDRTDIKTMKKYPFHTPIIEYDYFNNYRLPSKGKAQWYYQPGDLYTYIEVNVKNIRYNLRPSKKK